MNRTKNLVVASILGVLITLATYTYKTGPQFLPETRANWFYGFPLPFYKETITDIVGSVYQFSILYAVADFLIFFGVSVAVLILAGSASPVVKRPLKSPDNEAEPSRS